MTDIYAAIETIAMQEKQPVISVCEVLEVSRSAYHVWKTRDASSREVQDAELAPLVRDIFWKHKRRSGARRIAKDLIEIGQLCDVRRVGKLMRNQHLVAIQPKSFVPKTTDSRHKLGYIPNLLLEMPESTGIDQLWVGDITYIRAVQIFCTCPARRNTDFRSSGRKGFSQSEVGRDWLTNDRNIQP